jgi:hypothetical protein
MIKNVNIEREAANQKVTDHLQSNQTIIKLNYLFIFKCNLMLHPI